MFRPILTKSNQILASSSRMDSFGRDFRSSDLPKRRRSIVLIHAILLTLLHPVRPDPSLFLNPDDGSAHSGVPLELPWHHLALPSAGFETVLGVTTSPVVECKGFTVPIHYSLNRTIKTRENLSPSFCFLKSACTRLRGLLPLCLAHLCPPRPLSCCDLAASRR